MDGLRPAKVNLSVLGKTKFGVPQIPHTIPGLEAYWDLGLYKALEFRLMVL